MRFEELAAAAAFGALSGGRSAMGPALLALEKRQRAGIFSARRARRISNVMLAMAAGELIADKLPFMPSRTGAMSVAGRATSGALVGAALSPGSRAAGACVGALAAVAATFVLHRARAFASERLRLPLAAALLEDALVIGAGRSLAPRMG